MMRSKTVINLVLICLASFITGVSLTLITPFYPTEALSKGVTVTQSGIVLSTVFLATVLFTPVFGKYIQIVGARHSILIGAVLIGVGNITFGFLTRVQNGNLFFGLSIFIRTVIALGESLLTPAAFTLAGRQVSRSNQGKATSLAESFNGVGSLFGPTIGGLLYDVGGFALPFGASGGFSLILSLICVFCLTDVTDLLEEETEADRDVSWREVLLSPGLSISVFSLICASVAWQWYSPSLEPFLLETFSLSASDTGLVFTAFGVTYTVVSPLAGLLTDQGLDCLVTMVTGNILILIAFIFLGPIPAFDFLGSHLSLTVFCVGTRSSSVTLYKYSGLQGVGTALVYIGCLLYMMKGVSDAGLPDKEQTRAMVSSLWLMGDSVGGYLGDTLGSIAYDTFGFQSGTVIMLIIMIITVILSSAWILRKLYKESSPGEGKSLLRLV